MRKQLYETILGIYRVAIILYSYREVEHGTTKPNRAEDSHGQLQAGNVAVVTIQKCTTFVVIYSLRFIFG